ncbi:hypothetical protein Q3G72_000728 [Acer saccharum]|nr:hypothetical protein Q3G72_000728 [Acer saccharum]
MPRNNSRHLPLETLQNRSRKPSLSPETDRRPPFGTVAPPRRRTPERAERRGEAQGPVPLVDKLVMMKNIQQQNSTAEALQS